MKKFFLLSILVILSFGFVNAQAPATGDFRSNGTGPWATLGTWQRFDGTTWVTPAPSLPTSTSPVLIRNGHTITVGASTATAGNLTVGEGASGALSIGAFIITVSGTTTIAANGSITITSATGAKTFTGDFSNSGTWTNTAANSPVTFAGSITNSGTFNAGTGLYTLSGNGTRTISGTIAFGQISQTIAGGAYTNNGTLTVSLAHTITTATNSFTNAGTYTCTTGLNITAAAGRFYNNGTATINGSTVGSGTFVNNAGATMNNGAASLTFVLDATAANNTVIYNGSAVQTVKGTTYDILQVNKSGGSATMGAATIVNNSLTLTAGSFSTNGVQLSLNGTYSNPGGTLTVPSGGTLSLTGTSSVNFNPGTYTTPMGGTFSINKTGGAAVTLTAPVQTTTLALTSGILNTTNANYIRVTGTATTNITGGGTSSYVNGPLERTFPTLTIPSTVIYAFPIGKAGFNQFQLINPVTTSGTIVRAEVFDSYPTAATWGAGLDSLGTQYWQTTVTGTLSGMSGVELYKTGVLSTKSIGQCATLGGEYQYIGGTWATNTLTTESANPAWGFYAIGKEDSLCGTYTVGTGEDFINLSAVSGALNNLPVKCDVRFELTSNYNGTTGESFQIKL